MDNYPNPTPIVSRVYLDCGAKEAGGRMLPVCAQLAEHLRQRGYGPTQVRWRPDPRGTHNEQHWKRRTGLRRSESRQRRTANRSLDEPEGKCH